MIITEFAPGTIQHITGTDPRELLATFQELGYDMTVIGVDETLREFRQDADGVMRHHEMTWIDSLLRQFHEMSLKEIIVTTMNGNQATGFQYIGRKA